MSTNEIKEEDIRTIVKLGVNVKDIADIYLRVASKGHDISKQKFIGQLTKKLKFFQSRNNGLDEKQEVIYKDDVLNMLVKNKNMINFDIEKKIKNICSKLDSYYFMTKAETNKVIKNNPNIFNVNIFDLEIYATILSNYVVEIDNNIVNLFEYVVKRQSDLLNQNVNDIYLRLRYLVDKKATKKLSIEEISNLGNVKFMISGKEIKEKDIKKFDDLPKYNGENIVEYKEKIKRNIQ